MPQNQYNSPVVASLKTEQAFLNKVLDVFRNAKLTDDGKRVEPTFAVFAGAPGNFKSQMIDFLCCELQRRTLDPERYEEAKRDHFRYVFKRDQANVYWDGYRDPHITIFDDLGQFKTCVQNIDNEFSSIMGAVNELPMMLHVAAVDAKSSTYFKSRFILATTNFTKPSIENVNSREAYERRIAGAFYMVPKPQFRTPETMNMDYMNMKLDKSSPLLPRGPKGEVLTHPAYHSLFVRYNPASLEELETMEFNDMVEFLVQDYMRKDKYFEQKMTELEDAYAGKMPVPIVPDFSKVKGKQREVPVFKRRITHAPVHRPVSKVDMPWRRMPRPPPIVEFASGSAWADDDDEDFPDVPTLTECWEKEDAVAEAGRDPDPPILNRMPEIHLDDEDDDMPLPDELVMEPSVFVLFNQYVAFLLSPQCVPPLRPASVHMFGAVCDSAGHVLVVSDAVYEHCYRAGWFDEDMVPQSGQDIFVDAPTEFQDTIDCNSDRYDHFEQLISDLIPEEVSPLNSLVLEKWMQPFIKAFVDNPEYFKAKLDFIRGYMMFRLGPFISDHLLFAKVLKGLGYRGAALFSKAVSQQRFMSFFASDPTLGPAISMSEISVHIVTQPSVMQQTWLECFEAFKKSLYTESYAFFVKALDLLRAYSPLVVFIVTFAISFFFVRRKEKEEEPVSGNVFSQSKDDHHKEYNGRSKANKRRQRIMDHEVEDLYMYRGQMGKEEDRSSFDLANRITYSSLVQLEFYWEDRTVRIGHGLIIVDRVMVVPRHYAIMGRARAKDSKYADAKVRLTFRAATPTKLVETFIPLQEFYDPANWIETDNLTALDQTLYILPPCSSRTYRNIMRNIADRSYHQKMSADMGFLMGFEDHRDFHSVFKLSRRVGQGVSNPDTGRYVVQNSYVYHSSTDYGDCGTPLYVVDKTTPVAKIIGMHVAGTQASPKMGISSPLVREYLEEALEAVPQMCKIHTEDEVFENFEVMDLSNPTFRLPVKSLVKQSDPSRSQIYRSVLYGAWSKPKTKPAFLRTAIVDGETIDVKEKAYDKVAVGEWSVSTSLVSHLAKSYYADLLQSEEVQIQKRIYTFEEAIVGLDDDPDFGSISRNTSPGYPYVFWPAVKRCPGRRYWFGVEDEYDISNERVQSLKRRCSSIISSASEGIRLEHVFMDFLKDERRPIEKVEAGKTRMVNAGPLDYLIVVRMYFGAFANWYTKNRILNGSAIGVNPYSKEWNFIANRMNQFGVGKSNMGAGDYSAYDGSEKPVVHDAILSIINDWYDDGDINRLIRTVLWAEVVNARHMNRDVFYSAVMSLPSGHPLTALINTMYNAIAFRYCWYRANENSLSSLKHFTENVYTIMLGDDNIYSVSHDFQHVFNDAGLQVWMKEFGLTYTNESKTEQALDLRKLEEISFLKRKFRFEPRLSNYVAPLDIDVVLEMPYWTRKGHSVSVTESNVETSIMELALHGEDLYNTWAYKIRDACLANSVKCRVDDFEVQLSDTVNETWFF